MKEGAARAVLHEVWLRGHRCVELQRDGRRTIFVCTRCRTRCYSDGALIDHLRGNLHARVTALISSSQNVTSSAERPLLKGEPKEQEDGVRSQGNSSSDALVVVPQGPTPRDTQILLADSPPTGETSKTPLQWIGSGELFFSTRSAGSAPFVEASWVCWRGKEKASPETESQSWRTGGIVYAVVMFPYSDMIGRGGNWKPWFGNSHPSEAEDLMLLEHSKSTDVISPVKLQPAQVASSDGRNDAPLTDSGQGVVQVDRVDQRTVFTCQDSLGSVRRRGWRRKKPKLLERLCFICHQRMNVGKDVAALLNLQTKQMVCGSRNKRGVFHVYHSSCLIDWISMYEVKIFSGTLDHGIDRSRRLSKSRRAIIGQLKKGSVQEGSSSVVEGNVFCPECQGTGLKVRGSQLERPRYRLSQVFDWVLELIQARKAWSENPKGQELSQSGLLFCEELKGTVLSRGLVHYYSGCPELLAGNGSVKL
ncbi:hypothetical protein R1sor_019062 [Riccia sorocarpa]|uniref:C2H2-type domain-containing protein n=1 Tax=Riccia sorocarpa TaxID=122646 RepID=A0ABD3IBG6_9MARC